MAEIFRDNGYGHDDGRQVAPHQGRAPVRRRPPSTRGPARRASTASTGSSTGSPTSTSPTGSYEDNHHVDVDRYPDGYYFTDDLTDRAIDMIRDVKASNPTQAVLPATSPTAPSTRRCRPSRSTSTSTEVPTTPGGTRSASPALRPPARARRRSRPARALPPRNHEEGDDVEAVGRADARPTRSCSPATWRSTPAWSTASTRSWVGSATRSRSWASWTTPSSCSPPTTAARARARTNGTTPYFRTLGLQTGGRTEFDDVDVDHARLDLIGGPQTLPHYPRGWAMVSNTPFRLYKINTHAGRPPGAVHRPWPKAVEARRPSCAASTSTSPTCCPPCSSWSGVDASRPSAMACHACRPPGSSFAPVLADATACVDAPRAVLRDDRPPGLLPRRVGGGHPAPAPHPVRRPRVGAVRPRRAIRPRPSTWPPSIPSGWPSWPPPSRRRRGPTRCIPLDEGTGLKMDPAPAPRELVFEARSRSCPGTPTLERYRSLQLINSRSCRRHRPPRRLPSRRPGQPRGPRRPGRWLRALRRRGRAAATSTTATARWPP